MPKTKRREKKNREPEILQAKGAQFVDVPKRLHKIMSIDLTEDGSAAKGIDRPADFQDAVVKTSIRYFAGDEERAQSVIDSAMKGIKTTAHYVRPVERIVVREKRRRMEEIKHGLRPLEAARLWLEKKKPKHIEAAVVLKLLSEYLDAVPTASELADVRPERASIRSFVVENFMPFRGRQVVEEIGDGLFGIVAQYENQETRSNRAGKSALLDAIFYALFGEGRDLSTFDRHISDGEEALEVGLGLEIGGQAIPVVRQMKKTKRSLKSDLSVGNAEVSVREGNAEIIKLLGQSKEDFARTCYVKQGDLVGILDKTSGQLKEDIIRWKHLGVWNDIGRAIASDAKEKEDEIALLESVKEAAEGRRDRGRPEQRQIEEVRESIENAAKRNAELAVAEAKVKELKGRFEVALKIKAAKAEIESAKGSEEQLAALRKAYEEAKEANREIEMAGAKIRTLQRDLDDHAGYFAAVTLSSQEFDRTAKHKKAKAGFKKIEKAFQTAAGHEAAATMEEKRCRLLATEGFNGTCPVDSSDCPRTEAINSNRKSAETALANAESVLAEKLKERKARQIEKAAGDVGLADLRDAVKESEQAGEKIKATKSEIIDLDADKTRREIKKLRDIVDRGQVDLTGIDNDIFEVTANIQLATEAKGALATIKEKKSAAALEKDLGAARIDARAEPISARLLQDNLADLLARVKLYDEALGEIEDCEKKLKILIDEMQNLNYLRHLCGKRGIPSMMIESALVEIEDRTNEILDELGTDHRLKFQFERELKRPARVCDGCGEVFPETEKVKFCEQCGAKREREKSDELRPMVLEGDREQEFGQDSGAGRDLLALAVRVVLSEFLGASILFLDEVSGSFDDYHLPKLLRLLRRLPKMGFTQVFLITHQKEVADALPRNLLVLRIPSEGRSEFGWEVEG